MGEIWGTCGHQIKRVYWAIEFEDENERKMRWSIVVCPQCFKWYKKHMKLIRSKRFLNK